MKFTDKETGYFCALVKYCNSKAGVRREEFYREMLSFKPRFFNITLEEENSYFMENRMCSIILMLHHIYKENFRLEPYWIINRLRFPCDIESVNKAITFLCEKRFLLYDDGRLVSNAKRITSTDEQKSESVRKAHSLILGECQDALRLPLTEREFGHLTFIVAKEDLPELKNRIKKIQGDVSDLASEFQKKNRQKKKDHPGIAVCLNIQL